MPLRHIVIVGSGVGGWLAAVALANKTACAITMVETVGADSSLGLPSPIEATLSSMPKFHRAFGLDEDQLLARTGASFTLGRALSNWTSSPAPSFHPYGDIGASLGPVGFHHLVARKRLEGESVNLANYSVAALCAQSGRFSRPPADLRSVLSTMGYGLHLETSAYRGFLKRAALDTGVKTSGGAIVDVEWSADNHVRAVRVEGGEEIAGDLFLDCSGPSRHLIGKLSDGQFEDWSELLPCNRFAASFQNAAGAPPAYTHIDAADDGWRVSASTQNVSAHAQVSCGAADDRSVLFTSGRISHPWHGNCIAIGGAAAVIDPIASTQLHLAASSVARLLTLLPTERQATAEANEYNRQSAEELENARDYAALHYLRNGRFGIPFWDSCRSKTAPPRLAHKVALYEGTGRLALYDNESFEASDWVALFDALGIVPKRYDVMADAVDSQRLTEFIAQIRNAMLNAVATLPPHHAYLAQLRKATA